jgi:AAA domain
MITFEQMRAAFPGEEKRGVWVAECPLCRERHLHVKEKGGTAVVKCWTDNGKRCTQAKVWSAVLERFTVGKSNAAPEIEKQKEWPGLTLKEYAESKGLSQLGLTLLFGVYETTYKGKKTGNVSKPVVAFPYSNGKGLRTGTKVRAGSSHETEWQKGESGKYIPQPYGLCRPELADCSDIVLCEGESDVHTLSYYRIPALGISGADNWKSDFAKLDVLRNAERIFIIKEPDEGGQTFVDKVRKDLPPEKVYVVEFPADAPDPSALHLKYLNTERAGPPHIFGQEEIDAAETQEDSAEVAFRVIEERRQLLESGEWNPRANDPFLVAFDAAIAAAKSSAGTYTLRSLADATLKPVTWLWKDRVPKGMLSIWGGAPGSCKSMASCSLAAIVTTQKPFPDCPNENEPMDVLLFFSEDDAETTVAPRLEAAGADRRRVHEMRISCPSDATQEERQLALKRDLPLLEKALRENPRIGLVVVDPLTSFIGDIDINKEQEVRAVLIPLKDMAERTGVTFVLIAHFNKRSDVTALNRIMGAVAMTGVARATWLFAEDKQAQEEEGLERYLMLRGKVNVGRKREGLMYTIAVKTVTGNHGEVLEGIPYVVWGEETSVSADAALSFSPSDDTRDSKLNRAVDWLREFLSDGRQPSERVEDEGKLAGFSLRTLKSAKELLQAKSQKEGKIWFWSPPV